MSREDGRTPGTGRAMSGAAAVGGPGAGDFGDVLVRLAAERPNLLVVAGEDIGPAAWFAEVWPDRALVIGPLATRLAVAEGVGRAGGDAVVVLERDVAVLPLAAEAPVVVVTEHRAHLSLAHRAGLDVCQPGWPADLPALLVGGLGADRAIVLHLPALPREGTPPAGVTFGAHRVLHRGPAGLVVGSGPTARVAAAVAAHLAGGGVAVTALDTHTVTAASGVEAALLVDHLLVGPLDAPRAAALDAVPVDGAVDVVADRVRAHL